MAGYLKGAKPTPETSKLVKLAEVASSVDPNCSWVVRKKYYSQRQLVTRNDVRIRTSFWSRFIGWCRGVSTPAPENEIIFTVRH